MSTPGLDAANAGAAAVVGPAYLRLVPKRPDRRKFKPVPYACDLGSKACRRCTIDSDHCPKSTT